ncbi:hypothetical protein TELCIR_18024 [Teladorsagia circumcincta]|uniref:Right handed beta helix domain-containing protein n=1 Tax=Teladorsagia circumcincta TaxID=45464 RepID=A0A2G9TR40_TELCI|nr:hypothetical protein TELCIR_18024 [Teladorsagia circumcincta]
MAHRERIVTINHSECVKPEQPKANFGVLINWVEFLSNSYHPALEIHSCQGFGTARTVVDVTGNRIEGNGGMGFRIAPAVNVLAYINSNQFLNNNDTALFIKNANHPQLWPLKANGELSRTEFFGPEKQVIFTSKPFVPRQKQEHSVFVDGTWGTDISLTGRPANDHGQHPMRGERAIRCAEPRWAGVRYSLLANPPTFTGQTTMSNWIIEKAGLFDFRVPVFSPALQIDWNYHVFHNLHIRNNFWNGIDIVYNDLIKKPAIRNSIVTNNRRNGMHLRSVGITLEDRDIVSWLDLREQPELEANNIYIIPDKDYQTIQNLKAHPTSSGHPDSFCGYVDLEDKRSRAAFAACGFAARVLKAFSAVK